MKATKRQRVPDIGSIWKSKEDVRRVVALHIDKDEQVSVTYEHVEPSRLSGALGADWLWTWNAWALGACSVQVMEDGE